MSEKLNKPEGKKMPIDPDQGLLKFPAEEEVKQTTTEPEIEKPGCSYCGDVGFCMFCERGKLFTQERKNANAGKVTKNSSFYAKRRWKYKSK